MIRVFLEVMTLFFLPTLIYVAFAIATRRPGLSALAALDRMPVFVLSILGAGLVTGVLALLGSEGTGKPGQAYEPAVMKDGKLIPGHMR